MRVHVWGGGEEKSLPSTVETLEPYHGIGLVHVRNNIVTSSNAKTGRDHQANS